MNYLKASKIYKHLFVCSVISNLLEAHQWSHSPQWDKNLWQTSCRKWVKCYWSKCSDFKIVLFTIVTCLQVLLHSVFFWFIHDTAGNIAKYGHELLVLGICNTSRPEPSGYKLLLLHQSPPVQISNRWHLHGSICLIYLYSRPYCFSDIWEPSKLWLLYIFSW